MCFSKIFYTVVCEKVECTSSLKCKRGVYVSDWLLFNANSPNLQPYHGENKLMRWWLGLLCTRPTHLLDLYCTSSLKQKSEDRHVASIGHIIMISSQPVFTLILLKSRIAEKHQYQFNSLWFDPTRAWIHNLSYLSWAH